LQIQGKQTFMTHIIESPIFNSFYNTIKDGIKKTSEDLNYNVKLLENLDTGVMRCYNFPEKCPAVLNDLSQKLHPIDNNLIDQIKGSYNFGVTVTSCTTVVSPPYHNCRVTLHGSSVAMPIDRDGHFRWENSGHNNTLTILENNDGTISLGINGMPHYRDIHASSPGQYQIHHAPCLKTTDPIPAPFNEHCHYTHTPMIDKRAYADMIIQDIDQVF